MVGLQVAGVQRVGGVIPPPLLEHILPGHCESTEHVAPALVPPKHSQVMPGPCIQLVPPMSIALAMLGIVVNIANIPMCNIKFVFIVWTPDVFRNEKPPKIWWSGG